MWHSISISIGFPSLSLGNHVFREPRKVLVSHSGCQYWHCSQLLPGILSPNPSSIQLWVALGMNLSAFHSTNRRPLLTRPQSLMPFPVSLLLFSILFWFLLFPVLKLCFPFPQKKKKKKSHEIWFTYHTIHPFKAYKSVVFSIFRVVQWSLQSILECFNHPKEIPSPLSIIPHFPPAPPLPEVLGSCWSTFYLYRFFSTLEGSYKWRHETYSILHIAAFI